MGNRNAWVRVGRPRYMTSPSMDGIADAGPKRRKAEATGGSPRNEGGRRAPLMIWLAMRIALRLRNHLPSSVWHCSHT